MMTDSSHTASAGEARFDRTTIITAELRKQFTRDLIRWQLARPSWIVAAILAVLLILVSLLPGVRAALPLAPVLGVAVVAVCALTVLSMIWSLRNRLSRWYPIGCAYRIALGDEALMLENAGLATTVNYSTITSIELVRGLVLLHSTARGIRSVLPREFFGEDGIRVLTAKTSPE